MSIARGGTHRTMLTIARQSVATVLACTALISCASLDDGRCAGGEAQAVHEQLYLGTGKAGGSVTREEWAQFLATVVTPRFPDGFTVWEASGQWRRADGTIVRELSYVLDIVHPAGARTSQAVGEIAASYKQSFGQEAVLRATSNSCTSF